MRRKDQELTTDLDTASATDPALYAANRTCKRLFSYRKAQPWPPTIEKQSGWDKLYAELAEGLSVTANVDDAVQWVNDLVARINEAE